MTVLRIDHSALAVRALDPEIERYRTLFGVEPASRQLVPEQRVEVAFLPLGDTKLELISPTDPDSGVARFLERHGPGLHHVALQVADIRGELRRLESLGVQLIDREPRAGVHGLIAFIHPRSTGGLLVELVQPD